MAKHRSSRRTSSSTRKSSRRQEQYELQDEHFRGDHNYEDIRAPKRAPRSSIKERSHRRKPTQSFRQSKDRSIGNDIHYPALAQPEPIYADFYRGDASPSPPPEEPYTYMACSREKGEHYEFEDDRPLSRRRLAYARIAQVSTAQIILHLHTPSRHTCVRPEY